MKRAIVLIGAVVSYSCMAVAGGEGESTDGVPLASGRVFYVATNGSDANDGSLSRPWATIRYASTRVAAGDTVVVQDGTYHLPSGRFLGDLAVASNGAAGSPITYRAAHKWAAKLVGSGSGDGSVVVGVSGSH